jgi:hypothetical protein
LEREVQRQWPVIIGVHTPEFPFEKDESNVRKAVRDLGITYPVAMDNDYRMWRSFNNEYWPAHYFVDATGRIRYHHFGEGGYDESENWIRNLLEEANHKPLPEAPHRSPQLVLKRRPTLAMSDLRRPTSAITELKTLPRRVGSIKTSRKSTRRPPTSAEERLYQLIRQHGAIPDHTFRIEFLVPGIQAYAFTFG